MDRRDYSGIPAEWRSFLKQNHLSARMVAIRGNLNLPHFYNVLNGKASPTFDYADKVEKIIFEMVDNRFWNSKLQINGDSIAIGRDPQQRTDGGLPSESSAPAQG